MATRNNELIKSRDYIITDFPYCLLQIVIENEIRQIYRGDTRALFYDALYFGRELELELDISKMKIPEETPDNELGEEHRTRLRNYYKRLKSIRAKTIFVNEKQWSNLIFCSRVLVFGLSTPKLHERHPYVTSTFKNKISYIYEEIIKKYEALYQMLDKELHQNLDTETQNICFKEGGKCMKLYNAIQRIEEIEENMPYSFEFLDEELTFVSENTDRHDFVAIEKNIHISLKDTEDIPHMISLFIDAFNEKVYVYNVEVSGDVYYEVIGNKREAALHVIKWISKNSLVLDHVLHTESWIDDAQTFKYDTINDVESKLSLLK